MIMKVLQFPLIKITGCFVLGIFVAHYTNPPFLWTLIGLMIGLSLLGISYFISKIKLSFSFDFLALTTSFFLGIFTLTNSNQTLDSNHYIHHLTANKAEYTSEVVVKEKLKNTGNNDRYVVNMIQLNGKSSYGKIILNIRKETAKPTIEIGSHLKVLGSLYKNRAPNNPNQFDYGSYLENQQIYAQLYADANDIKINPNIDKNIFYYANRLRNKIIQNLEKNHFSKSELSVVVALILGQQQDISPEIVRDYQYAGAVHVLSVSGLHVGFILLFITFLLKPFPNTKRASLIKLIIVILSLWAFGILAGLAPSVVRSVTMFSFVAIGMHLRRSINIYNTLAVSAFLILLFQPSFLFEIGFQLSYIALFFIVWLQPLLSAIWKPKYKITAYFWDIITVSFAAQIGTLPLSIYYFHQFPGLFFVTNLVILPGMSLILGLGVIVMVMAAFDFVWMPLLNLLEWSIGLLNKTIAWIASFENFILKDISFNSYMMWSCYLLIFSWIIWIKKPTYKKLVLSSCTIILLQLVTFEANYSNQNKIEFLVFSKKKNTIITERLGNNVTLFSNDSILKTASDNLALKSYLVANFCRVNKKKDLTNTYYFKGKKILLLDNSATYPQEAKPDVVILTNSPKINLERIFKTHKPEQIVADASNFKSYIKTWKATCVKEKIPFHDTAEKGFYKL